MQSAPVFGSHRFPLLSLNPSTLTNNPDNRATGNFPRRLARNMIHPGKCPLSCRAIHLSGGINMEERTDTEETVPVMEAAEALGTTHLRILMLIKEGALKGGQDGGEWFVTRDSLDCFSKHGGDVQAKSTCRSACGGGSCGGHG
jgi:hypothetical protein